jgi:hypothetical protein
MRTLVFMSLILFALQVNAEEETLVSPPPKTGYLPHSENYSDVGGFERGPASQSQTQNPDVEQNSSDDEIQKPKAPVGSQNMPVDQD